MENKELQNNDFILPGNLGTIRVGIAGQSCLIQNALLNKGSVTLTIKPIKKELPEPNKIEDAIFEILPPHQLTNTQPKE